MPGQIEDMPELYFVLNFLLIDGNAVNFEENIE